MSRSARRTCREARVARRDGFFGWPPNARRRPRVMMTSFYDIAVGLTTVLLLTALGWSVTLRRKVKEQAERIRLQLLREASLEKQFGDLCENANDMIYTHDMHGILASLNKTGERIIGYGREKAVGMSLREFVASEQREKFDQWIETCKNGNASPRRSEEHTS